MLMEAVRRVSAERRGGRREVALVTGLCSMLRAARSGLASGEAEVAENVAAGAEIEEGGAAAICGEDTAAACETGAAAEFAAA